MTRLLNLSLTSLLIALLAACASTPSLPPPAPPVVDAATLRLDPRFGYTGVTPPSATRPFNLGIQALQAGQQTQADTHFAAALQAAPGFAPALVGRAVVALDEGRLDEARTYLERASAIEQWPATELLAAELTAREGNVEESLKRYEALAAREDAGAVYDARIAELRQRQFDALYARAGSEPAAEAIETLRRAIAISDQEGARLLLARRLIELQRYDEARRSLDQLLLRGPGESDQIQELLAEIDYGKGRYQEAITRLEPLARKDPARHGARLTELKQRWSEANMPPRYHSALDSAALTRSQLAVLVYWKVPPVRFATGLAEPPIAVDVSGVAGREEMIRAMALGLFPVDPITRTVGPDRLVSSANLERILSRVLRLRGVPACAAPVAGDPAAELEACGIPVPMGDSTSGEATARALDAIADRLGH